MVRLKRCSKTRWEVACPYCFRIICFSSDCDSPFYCPYCDMELPEFSSLLTYIDERIDLHTMGKEWLYGPGNEGRITC